MELKGKIKLIKDVQEGTSKSGKEWKKLEFVISNNEGYEDSEQIFCFEIFGDEKVEKFLEYNSVGKEVDVSFNIRVNEWEGKHFTTLQAWNVFGSSNEVNDVVNETSISDDTLPF